MIVLIRIFSFLPWIFIWAMIEGTDLRKYSGVIFLLMGLHLWFLNVLLSQLPSVNLSDAEKQDIKNRWSNNGVFGKMLTIQVGAVLILIWVWGANAIVSDIPTLRFVGTVIAPMISIIIISKAYKLFLSQKTRTKGHPTR